MTPAKQLRLRFVMTQLEHFLSQCDSKDISEIVEAIYKSLGAKQLVVTYSGGGGGGPGGYGRSPNPNEN